MGEHLRMSPSSRRLSFVVGTSLLTASLATGCKKSEPTVNPGPEVEAPHVNEGPEPVEPGSEENPDATTDAASDELEPDEPATVNVRHAEPK
jgi:hypothetical protein